MPGFGLSTFMSLISMTNVIVMTPYELGTIFILIFTGNRLRWGHATSNRQSQDQFLVCLTPKPVLALCSIMSLSPFLSSILMVQVRKKGEQEGRSELG